MGRTRPLQAFVEASLPAWLVLGLLLWQGGGRADFGLAGLAALLFASVWPALRLRPYWGSPTRRAVLYLLFGVALAAGQLGVMLLVAIAARWLVGTPAQAGTNTAAQAVVMLLVVTGVPFLLVRALLALPGAVRALGWRRLLGRTFVFGVLGLIGLGLAGGGLYVLFSGPYMAHNSGEPLAIGASTALAVSGSAWQTASPGLALRASGAAVEAVFDPGEPTATGYFSLIHPWAARTASGGNGLRLRAQSDTELYLVARVSLDDGSAYEAEANLLAGDERMLILEPFLPAPDAPASLAGLDWERVTALTLIAYPAPGQTAPARLAIRGLDQVEVAHPRAWTEARSDHFLVRYHAVDEAAAQATLLALEERYATAAAVTGVRPAVRVPVQLAADHAEYERIRGGGQLSAWAVGGVLHSSLTLLTPRCYALIYNGKQPDSFPEVARHELTHLLVSRAVGYRGMWAMPVWLHEGLAVYVAGQDADEADNLQQAASRGDLPTLAELVNDAGFRQEARWAYPMAGVVVRYLVEEFGAERLPVLLQAFHEGQSAEAALEAVYGLSPDGLDTEWRAALGSQPR